MTRLAYTVKIYLHAPIYEVLDQSNTAILQKQTNVDELLVTEPLASPTYIVTSTAKVSHGTPSQCWPFTL